MNENGSSLGWSQGAACFFSLPTKPTTMRFTFWLPLSLILGLTATHCCPPSRTLAAFKPLPSSLAALPYQAMDSLVFVDSAGTEWMFHSPDGWQEQDYPERVCTFCQGLGVNFGHDVSLRLNYIDFIGTDSRGDDSIYFSLGCHAWFVVEDSVEPNRESCTYLVSSVPAERLLPLDLTGASVDASAPSSRLHPLWYSNHRYVSDPRQAPNSTAPEDLILNWRAVADTTLAGRTYATLWVPRFSRDYENDIYYSPQVGIVAFRYEEKFFTLR
jgi:hypothetical protein